MPVSDGRCTHVAVWLRTHCPLPFSPPCYGPSVQGHLVCISWAACVLATPTSTIFSIASFLHHEGHSASVPDTLLCHAPSPCAIFLTMTLYQTMRMMGWHTYVVCYIHVFCHSVSCLAGCLILAALLRCLVGCYMKLWCAMAGYHSLGRSAVCHRPNQLRWQGDR